MMIFECLPNEILLQCLEYLQAFDLFYAFNRLNHRFNQLIRQIHLYVNLENIPKPIFDEFCSALSLDPTIKNQIYSLYFPVDCHEFQTKTFFALFSSDEFVHLQNYGFLLPSESPLEYSNTRTFCIPFIVPPKLIELQRLSLIQNDEFFTIQPSVIHLTINQCNFKEFSQILNHFPLLKFFHIQHTDVRGYLIVNNQCHHQHLTQLIIDYFRSSFYELEIFLKSIPNLQNLTLSTLNNDDFLDTDLWEELIQSSLPKLQTFHFTYCCDRSNDSSELIESFNRFENHFRVAHQWLTEYIIGNQLSILYTIPYSSKTLPLSFDFQKFSHHLEKKITNVTDLFFYGILPLEYSAIYFPNVTSLTLMIMDELRTSEYLDYLKKTIDLFNLKHLDISGVKEFLTISFLESAPQISSLVIHGKALESLFDNVDLCQKLNRMIRRLNVSRLADQIFDDSFYQRKEFCEIFENIEDLICEVDHLDQVIFFLHQFRRLSHLNIRWKSSKDPHEHLSRLTHELQRYDVIHDVHIEHCTSWNVNDDPQSSVTHIRNYSDVNIRFWIGKKTF